MGTGGAFAEEAGKAPASSAGGEPASKIDLFADYSYWAPHGRINGAEFQSIDQGFVLGGSYFFNRWVGGQFEGERHSQTSNDGMRAFSAGPVFRLPGNDGMTPFVHALVGTTGLTGPNQVTAGGASFFNHEHWGVVLIVGGGVDFTTPLLHHHLGVRLFQVDYQYSHVNFGALTANQGGRANLKSARIGAGVIYHLGHAR
jgi:hypothetical protein